MAFSSRKTDRLVSFIVYSMFAGVAAWTGIRLINHSLTMGFYKDFFLEWETAIRCYDEHAGRWPHFTGNNHAQYMEQLVRLMREGDAAPPTSNEQEPFLYRLNRLGDPAEDIFVLCFSGKMVLYGISARTFSYLDRRIDGRVDAQRGRCRARKSKDGFSYIGQVLL
jgi:hypothetical protein